MLYVEYIGVYIGIRYSLFPSLLTKMKCLIRPVQVQLTMDPGYSISTARLS